MKVMIPTQAEGNCVAVRRGGKEAGGVTRGLRDTNRIGGGAVWASRHGMAKLMVIKRPSRKCGGRAGKAVVLIRGGLRGCPGMPVHREVFVGWQGTVVAGRLLLAAQKSAEAVVPAGSMVAGKGRTRSRASGRLVSWPLR